MSRIDRLNSKVLDAHKNKALNILVDIYLMLGIEELNKSKIKSGCFLITQAYVYALEDGGTLTNRYCLSKVGRVR